MDFRWISLGFARYCHYLGLYFCTSCHESEIRVIPARVAERWDFEPKKAGASRFVCLEGGQRAARCVAPWRDTSIYRWATLKVVSALKIFKRDIVLICVHLFAERGSMARAQVNQPLVPITSIRQTKASSQQILTEIHGYRSLLTDLSWREPIKISEC